MKDQQFDSSFPSISGVWLQDPNTFKMLVHVNYCFEMSKYTHYFLTIFFLKACFYLKALICQHYQRILHHKDHSIQATVYFVATICSGIDYTNRSGTTHFTLNQQNAFHNLLSINAIIQDILLLDGLHVEIVKITQYGYCCDNQACIFKCVGHPTTHEIQNGLSKSCQDYLPVFTRVYPRQGTFPLSWSRIWKPPKAHMCMHAWLDLLLKQGHSNSHVCYIYTMQKQPRGGNFMLCANISSVIVI